MAQKKYFTWELIILNPDEANYFSVLKDSWESTLVMETTPAGANTLDTLTVKFVDDSDATNAAASRYSL